MLSAIFEPSHLPSTERKSIRENRGRCLILAKLKSNTTWGLAQSLCEPCVSLKPSWGGGWGGWLYLRCISDSINMGDGGGFPVVNQNLLTVRVDVYSNLLQIQTSGFWNPT